MNLSDFDFDLPKRLVASRPVRPRSNAKLLSYHNNLIKDYNFFNLPELLCEKDLLIFNDSKVLPALLHGFVNSNNIDKKRIFELLLVNQINDKNWFCFCKPLKKIKSGNHIFFSDELIAQVLDKCDRGLILKFEFKGNFFNHLYNVGIMPIPPYIRKIRKADNFDKIDYQSIFSKKIGSIAAPTASLHFDSKLMKEIKNKGINYGFLTLHVGIGTFNPIRFENINEHKMHSEYGEINKVTADMVTRTLKTGGRVIPVGTTSLRILESLDYKNKIVKPFSGSTNIFIKPGYKFKIASGLITNFHLPKSSLYILIASFVGLKAAKKIYLHAVNNNYRFFSYGDGSILFRKFN